MEKSENPDEINKNEKRQSLIDDEIKNNEELKDKYTFEDYDPKKFVSKTHDDLVIDQIKKNDLKLKMTEIRKRQQTCTFKELKSDELPSFTKNFVPGNRKNLQELLSLDKHDESLMKYKKRLIGNINENDLKDNEPPEVEIIKIIVVCPERPGGNIDLVIENKNGENKVKEPFVIKENCIYNFRILFRVRFDCVYGFKMVANIFKHSLKVDKYEEMIGSFPPKSEIQLHNCTPEQAPSGYFSRGTYKGKAIFLDHDGIVHMQFEYTFRIEKDW